MRRATKLRQFDEVVAALGGFDGVSRATDAAVTAIGNWRARGRKFPARHYLDIERALRRRGLTACETLFTFRQVEGRGRKAT